MFPFSCKTDISSAKGPTASFASRTINCISADRNALAFFFHDLSCTLRMFCQQNRTTGTPLLCCEKSTPLIVLLLEPFLLLQLKWSGTSYLPRATTAGVRRPLNQNNNKNTAIIFMWNHECYVYKKVTFKEIQYVARSQWSRVAIINNKKV
jgi:hypothetical protein